MKFSILVVFASLLVLFIGCTLADPAERPAHRKENRAGGGGGGIEVAQPSVRNHNYDPELDSCLHELWSCHTLTEQGRFVDRKRQTGGEDADDTTQLLKARTLHIIEALRRARYQTQDNEKECSLHIDALLGAHATPSETIAARAEQLSVSEQTRQALRRAGAQRPNQRKEVEEFLDAKRVEANSRHGTAHASFEYLYIGPEGRHACTECGCMLAWQQRVTISSESNVHINSQMFQDGSTVVVKEEDAVLRLTDMYYMYYRGTQLVRLEQYRSKSVST